MYNNIVYLSIGQYENMENALLFLLRLLYLFFKYSIPSSVPPATYAYNWKEPFTQQKDHPIDD